MGRIAHTQLIVIAMLTLLMAAMPGNNTVLAQKGKALGEQIAFNRGGDVWLMNPDGSNQRPWVAGITNMRGRMSWAPDNKRIAFSRQGQVTIQYPEGGGGNHKLYNLFYAFTDSIGVKDNFWLGFVNLVGAQSPDWSKSGKLIVFCTDLSSNVVDVSYPDYTISLYNTETQKISHYKFPKAEKNLMGLLPTISPDGKKICFVLTELQKAQPKMLGLVICSTDSLELDAAKLLAQTNKIPDGNSPAWSPDGKQIAYFTKDGLYVANADLSGPKLVCKPEEGLWVSGIPGWSANSGKLAFGTSNGSIYAVNVDGSGLTKISGPGSDSNPAWTK